uniref:Carbonic anhydrase n=1 Tax=Drosophila rhopaloa TaxID=1041015 RepID=A0A6P4EFG8_DRORH
MLCFSFCWLLALCGCTLANIQIPEEYLAAIRQDRADDQSAGEYNYDKQGDDWTGTCATGSKQSPINLNLDESKIVAIPRLCFYHYDQALQTPLVITNNGHTANMVIPPTRGGQRAGINGGLLPGDFEVQSVHFHWGSKNSKGSEHSIGNRRYDVEMHIVHKNVKYDTMGEATLHPDGLAVLGVMLRSTYILTFQNGLDKIFNQLPKIEQYSSNATITGTLTVGQLLGGIITDQFFTYNGSLTTPDCAEAVTWTVFSAVINYSGRQIAKLWKLKDSREKPLVNNYRKIQETNGRDVYFRAI